MRFNMNNVKSINIPLAFNFKLYSSLCFSNKEENDYMSCVPCASVVRSLMYAMVCARPNISHAVRVVSGYMENLGREN
jgi:hypothetical protein